jgi:hypothetical protein
MTYRKVLKVPIYKCKVIVLVTDEMENEVNKVFKRLGVAHEAEDYYGIVVRHSVKIDEYYVVLDINDLSYNTIVHEISHLTGFILEDRDYEEIKLSGEYVAHLSGFLAQEVFDFIIKKGVPING